MLEKGINIIGSPEINLSERLTINSGGIPAKPFSNLGKQVAYDADAFIPKSDWRKLTAEETEIAMNNEAEVTDKSTIRILTIPKKIQRIIKELRFEDASSLTDIQEIVKAQPDLISDLDQQLTNMVGNFEISLPPKKTYIQGFFVADPGLPTVTFKQNSYVGLHIDYSVDRHKFYKENTVNRLCINIGREPRYFQYVNQTVEQLEKMINTKEFHDFRIQYESRDLLSIVSKFFTLFPEYSMLKFQLNPFEAYITPSDNMIHDGNSSEMSTYDISLSLLGFLKTLEHKATRSNA